MPATTAIDKQLIDLEKKYWDAMKSGDMATMQNLTADPCLVVGPQGVNKVSKRQLPEMMGGPDQRLRSYKFDENNISVRQINDNIAVLAYKVHAESPRDTVDAFDSSVWVRQGDRWECAAHTETLAGKPGR